MDEQTSLRTCTYGFSDNDRNIYSNLSLSPLRKWLDKLGDLDKQRSFLEPDKNLVVVDLNRKYLDYILTQIFPEYLSKAEHREEAMVPYPHHTQAYFLDVYEVENSPLVKINSRIKGRDSLTEKLTRDYAENGTLGLSLDSDLPFHVSTRDIFGVGLVVKDKETREQLEEQVCSYSSLHSIERKIHYGRHNAIRHTFVWKDNTIPTGMVFEVRFETEKEHYDNKNGVNEILSHDDYSRKKLKKQHDQGDNQIIILQKNGHSLEELDPVNLKNKYVQYTLINY